MREPGQADIDEALRLLAEKRAAEHRAAPRPRKIVHFQYNPISPNAGFIVLDDSGVMWFLRDGNYAWTRLDGPPHCMPPLPL